MSPRGHPDWKIPTGVLSSVEIEASELAVRTGFPDAFEGLGKVIFFELFGTDIGGWEIITSGLSAGADLQTNRYYWKPAALRLTPGTDANQNSSVQRQLPLINTRRMGISTLMSFETDDTVTTLYMQIFDNGTEQDFRIRIDGTNGQIALLNGSAVFEEIATIGSLGSVNRRWIYVKMTIDVENTLYGNVQVNDRRIDASAISGFSSATADQDHTRIILFTNDPGGNGEATYFDFVVVTVDEP